MEKITFAGVEINRISLGRLFFRKTMLLAYALLAIALFGIVFQAFFIHQFRVLSTMTYLAMGWLVLIAIKPMWQFLFQTTDLTHTL